MEQLIKICKWITLAWEWISRIARVIVKLDDGFLELKWFIDWFRDPENEDPEPEPEPENKNRKI